MCRAIPPLSHKSSWRDQLKKSTLTTLPLPFIVLIQNILNGNKFFYITLNSIIVTIKIRSSQFSPVHASTSYYESSNLTLSYHLQLALPSDSFLEVFGTKVYVHFSLVIIKFTTPS
jgi:hypothetical protein